MRVFIVRCLQAALLLSAVQLHIVNAHGLITWPRPQGVFGSNEFGLPVLQPGAPVDNCAHCLNGAGVAQVAKHIKNGLWTPYEPTNRSFPFRNDHGLCGDPLGNDKHMYGGALYSNFRIATYEQGDYVDFEAFVNVRFAHMPTSIFRFTGEFPDLFVCTIFIVFFP